ncbi:tRNA (adenosine(37)-N6)-threonylcarbamoyltransferase complex dimerization subunit type 1 TsaB [Marinilabiliaceae bacterium JC017]|nr:tRNA (adenosine(37)-N6)-threonylcarbamoyltransferase complex dimerization subunit type 1 TsaB [Marinilabiliaceae bacterium JC017]
MGRILCIETSTTVCSVALTNNGKVISSREVRQINSHASHLTVLIEEMINAEKELSLNDIDAVAVSSGPGSYTGLRIGVSTAKGICYALNKPLIAIDSLAILAQAAASQKEVLNFEANTLLCPMIDARRMEVYTALYDLNMNRTTEISAEIIDETSYTELLQKRPIVFFGNGAAKCKTVISEHNATFIDNLDPIATNMAQLANDAFQKEKFEDVAYFEPFYLKDFVATKPKKKIL